MKKLKTTILLFLFSLLVFSLSAQNYYYVFLTDKKDVKINPKEFFDSKAIERRIKCGLDLFDESDMPVNDVYKKQIEILSDDFVGESRWFNMLMLSASDENIAVIKQFPFVKEIVSVESEESMLLTEKDEIKQIETTESDIALSKQLQRMGGEYFLQNNINGKGVRIAVFDGGFPAVNKHNAFRHLRDNKQIVKTWNFPSKKENVYGWDQHGTMVLSCIAGIKDSEDYEEKSMLGLATGAEFLLARTEVNSEPKKEEFWWLQAVEWADQNGADIINSSLGYGKQRYKYTEMDGSSLVAKAANMAAQKGILVCNSAGNEGDDKSWRRIITPADADSIITVGGIIKDLEDYRRISFSSYGPTADGRRKPNLVNFGEAIVANPKNKSEYKTVFGTSFSSPLTAGFAACALQTNPKLTAIELKNEMEKSGDLYPYFDYAFGYGVPQAKYFVEKGEKNINPSFTIEETDEYISIKTINFVENDKYNFLWYNIQNEDETLDYYTQINLYYCQNYVASEDSISENKEKEIRIYKTTIKENQKINIFHKGYFLSFTPNEDNVNKENLDKKSSVPFSKHYSYNSQPLSVNVKKQEKNISSWDNFSKNYFTGYFSMSFYIPTVSIEKNYPVKYGKSLNYSFGLRYKYNACHWYSIGANLEIGGLSFYLTDDLLDFTPADIQDKNYKIKQNEFNAFKANLEFYQRFNFLKGATGCLFLDMGIYGGVSASGKMTQKISYKNEKIGLQKTQKINNELLDYGVKARFGYSWIALYAQYKISNTYYDQDYFFISFPKFSLGFELNIPF